MDQNLPSNPIGNSQPDNREVTAEMRTEQATLIALLNNKDFLWFIRMCLGGEIRDLEKQIFTEDTCSSRRDTCVAIRAKLIDAAEWTEMRYKSNQALIDSVDNEPPKE